MKKSSTWSSLTALAMVLCLGGAAATAAAPAARAKPAKSAVEQGSYSYKVQSGDTLRKIVSEYFANPRDAAGYRNVASLNHLRDPGHLAVDSTLVIPRRFLMAAPARALISGFRGSVTIDADRPAKVGSIVTEGARIATGANSSISLTLEDGSTVSLPSQSVIRLDRLRLVLISGEMQHVFRLEAGRGQFSDAPSRGPGSKFEVQTPVSVSAVRGTEFRVAVEDGGRASIAEVLKDSVAVSGHSGSEQLVNEGYAARTDQVAVSRPVRLLALPQVVLPLYHNADGSLVFNVTPIEGAKRYRVQIASDVKFLDVRDENVSDKPAISFKTSPTGSYYVKVSAIDAQGIEGYEHIYPFQYTPK